MMTRTTLGTLAITMVGMIALGVFAPQPAQANDTGRAIAAIAAGALVYGLLAPDRPSPSHRGGYYYEQPRHQQQRGPQVYDRRGYDYQSSRRGFWNGNSAPRGHYQPQPRRNPRQQYWQGYRQGYNPGYDRGRGSCYTGPGWGSGTWGYW